MSVSSLFSSFPVLYTKRLMLRQMEASDAEEIFTYYRNPHVTEHLDWHGPASVENTRELIAAWNQAYADRRIIPWGISMSAASRSNILGTILLMPTRGAFDDTPQYPLTVGYDLNAEYWNKGIMSEALQAVIGFSREHLGPRRIQAEVYPENTSSLKLLKKLGFEEEGLLRQYMMHEVTKQLLDVVMLALLF
ncbi:GNAT family protein [Paenibacillus oryzisoli]|uniref:GNAT family N-acetyltransferase n=1 Tax=Paenibacillus oryzisoli TaxID=1850517 RepID=UPI003D26B054